MKYTAQSVKYVSKNFIYLFPFAILPALLLSFSTDEEAIIHVIRAIFNGDISSWTFYYLFCAISVLNFGSWKSLVFGLIGIIIIVPCVAMLMALLEKHFRIGKRTFNGLWGKLNDNFLPTCGFVLFIVVLYELWALLTAALLFFVSRIAITVLAYILAGATFLVLHALLLYVIGALYLWLPCMQITGFRAIEALHYSYQLVAPVKRKTMSAQFFFLLLSETLICVCAMFVPNMIVFTLITTLLYMLMFLVFCVRMQIIYFDRDQIDRADLMRYYQR